MVQWAEEEEEEKEEEEEEEEEIKAHRNEVARLIATQSGTIPV